MTVTEQTSRASRSSAIYELPRLDELGDVVELTNGTANDNIKDGNGWYY